MKKWIWSAGILLLGLWLVRTPEYWNVFQTDENQYNSETFYGIIQEEYREDTEGKKLYYPAFSDVENGDILVTDSTYCLSYRHGHAAIVVDADKGVTLEAYGIGTKSEYSGLSEWRRYPHVLVLRLRAPESVREKIAEYAEQHLRGIPYMLSPGMIGDKDMDGTYWGTQCAHLVWAAFEQYGYDIDGDGGWLVTPADFTQSSLLQVVPQN